MACTVGNTTRRWPVSFVLAVGLLLGGVALSAPPVSAATTLHVTSCADDGGATTLRGEIAAAAAGSTIVFNQNCTIALASTLTLAKNVTIDGTGHAVVLDGGCTYGNLYGFVACESGGVTAFAVNSGVAASLSALTIQHASTVGNAGGNASGGAIDNNGGTVAVTNSTLSVNSANGLGGGIYNNGGTLTVTNSTLSSDWSDSGGGIYNEGGTVTVTNSTFIGNRGTGGGIFVYSGTLTVTHSTFTGNVSDSGGALAIGGGTATITSSTISGNSATIYDGNGSFNHGGGMWVDALATLTVTNSTIAGNSVGGDGNLGYGGGIEDDQGTLTLTNDTIAGNSATGRGGGVAETNSDYATLTNTIIAGNTAPDHDTTDIENVDTPFVSGGHNLIGSITIFGSPWHASDELGWAYYQLDPRLGPLGANGGPTATMPLLWGSPAAGRGDPAVCANAGGTAPIAGKDQRGLARPAACAIGAFEPLLSDIAPVLGPAGGGTVVTLTGAGYAPGATVSLGGVGCTNVHVVNSATLTCTSGAHAPGAVDVVVTEGGLSETAPGAYFYGAPNALPGGQAIGGFPGPQPNTLPATRPAGPAGPAGGIAPNPLPAARP